jgi:hypothetical protein
MWIDEYPEQRSVVKCGADDASASAPERLMPIVAPGHNSVITDARGDDWTVCHAVDSRRPRTKPTDDVHTRRVMLIDRLVYVDGWPRVDRGPSTTTRPGPAVR